MNFVEQLTVIVRDAVNALSSIWPTLITEIALRRLVTAILCGLILAAIAIGIPKFVDAILRECSEGERRVGHIISVGIVTILSLPLLVGVAQNIAEALSPTLTLIEFFR